MSYHNGYKHLAKVIFIGDSGCGRSTLLHRIKTGLYNSTLISTIGIDFQINQQCPEIKFQLWDTAGQERFRTITSAYYKGANALVIAFDCSDEISFRNVEQWASDVKTHANLIGKPTLPIILLVTKADLKSKRVIPLSAALEIAKRLNFAFVCETSTAENINVQEVLVALRFMLYSPNYLPDALYTYTYEQPGCRLGFNRDNLRNIFEMLPQEDDFSQGVLEVPNFYRALHAIPTVQPSLRASSSKTTLRTPLPKTTKLGQTLHGQYSFSEQVCLRQQRGRYMEQPILKHQIFKQVISEDNLCELCFSNPINTTIIGCKHHFACSLCLASGRVGQCLVCKASQHDKL